jgi:hypothetical protein
LPGLDGTGELFAPLVAAAPRGISTIVVDYPTGETSIEVLERRAREKLTNRYIVLRNRFPVRSVFGLRRMIGFVR